MGKSRFEGMEIAVREQAKIVDGSVQQKVDVETLEAEKAVIDQEVEQEIKEIKSTPINKKTVKEQAETNKSNKLKAIERECNTTVMQAEQQIKQAQHNADQNYNQAKLNIEKAKEDLENLKQQAQEMGDSKRTQVIQGFETVLASIDNTDKTIELKVEKAKIDGKKRKREIEIKLRSLTAQVKIVEEKKNAWKTFYNDTVAISKNIEQKKS